MKGMFRLSSSVSSPFFFLFLILLFELLFVSLSLQFSWDDKYVGGQFSIHPASRPSKSVLEGTGEALASYFLNNRGDDSTFIRRLISMCTKINEVGKAFGYHLLYLCLLCLLWTQRPQRSFLFPLQFTQDSPFSDLTFFLCVTLRSLYWKDWREQERHLYITISTSFVFFVSCELYDPNIFSFASLIGSHETIHFQI